MFNRQKNMMIYVVLGFLEAGKTNLIKDLLENDLYDRRAKTLIVACEEGEEEYEPTFLSKTGSVCEYIEEEEDFTGEHILPALKKYKPDRIFVEYNGMWRATKIIEFYEQMSEILFDRTVMIQTIDVVNDETFSVYIKNMPSLMTEHFKISEVVIDNRCTVEKTNKNAVRGSVKAVNPRAQISFESEDEEFYKMKEVMRSVRPDCVVIIDRRSVLTACNRQYGIGLDLSFNYYGSRDFTKLFFRKVSDQKVFLMNRIPAVMFTSGITMLNNKTGDTLASLDLPVLRKRVILMYYFLTRLT